jgi:phosphatidylserine/phosphatidylglycerophosphate/cardiolipin synthase-like enzyme
LRPILALLFIPALAHADTTVCFVPSTTSCTDIVVEQIVAAKTSVYTQAYGFTSKPIENALIDAFRRGVHVEVILDKSNLAQKYSGLGVLQEAGVPTTIDSAHAIAHNKIVVVDEAVVLTGSFNLTVAAQKHNAENLLVLHDPELAALYIANWRAHRAHAKAPTETPALPR